MTDPNHPHPYEPTQIGPTSDAYTQPQSAPPPYSGDYTQPHAYPAGYPGAYPGGYPPQRPNRTPQILAGLAAGVAAVAVIVLIVVALRGGFGGHQKNDDAAQPGAVTTVTEHRPGGTAAETTVPPATTTVTTTPPTVVTGSPVSVTGADIHGFYSGPRCNVGEDPAVFIGRTNRSLVVICQVGDQTGRYYYKGYADGNTIEVGYPTRSGSSFTATNGATQYLVSPSALVITDGGSTVANEPMLDSWVN
ncbi:hypothetical protein MYK68_06340 [Gordonia sp. PP30]|uniref:hypothetical protein n=1 Tax=Gordonia sp. PP30 TaxID=2935861 RepID=UPI001FFFB2BE|nr:hypothetical protein [Gordonia sp. PP30]UQE76205.1 hypothetical protein MYK68_06340 [Gordonia sp. PP30]